MSWGTGIKWPGQRKPQQPLSTTNARGLLCAQHMSKVYSRVMRQTLIPFLSPIVGEEQYGVTTKGGTEFPMFVCACTC